MGCTKIIYDLLPEKLFMGYGEEQLSRTLTFDISQMQAELPGGVPMIAYMRPRDELGYLASGVTLEGSTLTWELSAHVMQYKGIGGAQIVLVDESGEETHILKSHVMQMLIGSSIPLTGGEPPEPWETWLEQILAAAARAESAAADAEAQADRAETAEAGAQQALIDAGSPVLYGRAQTLTDTQQQTARGNIAAASAADVSDLKSVLKFTSSAGGQTHKFPVYIAKGVKYKYTNNTSALCTVNCYRTDGTYTQYSASLGKDKSVEFTPNEYFVSIGGWFNGTGTVTLEYNTNSVLIDAGVRSNKSELILGDIGRFSIDVQNRTVSWNKSLQLYTSSGRLFISLADANTQLSNYAVLENDRITVTIPEESTLVYRFTEGVLKIVNRNNVVRDDVILFGVYYQNDYGLIWNKYWRDYYIDHYADSIRASEVFNSEPYTGAYDWQTPVINYGKLFNGTSKVESFAYFTDPHVLGFADTDRNETKMQNYLKRVQKVYNSTPCSFMVCGGDWLNNSTTIDEACYRLGYLKGIAKHLLDGCHLVLGNHDTNYQGKADSASANYTGRLSDSTIASILYRETNTKKAYYSFDGANSKCYVLDTGIEHNTMLAYDWEQISWLAGKLIEDDAEHAIIFLHIINDTGVTDPYIFPATCGNLVEAYNNHTTITLNSVVYDFTSCTGHVDFWVAGHNHTDSTGTLGGIPYFITATNSYNSDVPLIDLVLADYDNRVVNIIRVGGTGTDRTISLD